MTARQFADLTEPRTKAASLIPFVFASAWAPWRYGSFEPALLALFLASLLPIDLATTALNNALDWRRAQRAQGNDGRTVHGMRFAYALAVSLILFITGAGAGLILAALTGPVTLAAGIAAFAVAVAYSAGPLPISRTPLGEAFSGLTMGGGIAFVAVHIQTVGLESARLAAIAFDGRLLSLSVNVVELASLALASLPFILLIANVMLANNLRDVERDRASGRVTLPLAIGRLAALRLFAILSAVSYLAIPAAIALGALPVISLAAFATLPPVMAGTLRFLRAPADSVPFGLSVRNLFLAGGVLALSVVGAALLRVR